jgi:hypothetical protein
MEEPPPSLRRIASTVMRHAFDAWLAHQHGRIGDPLWSNS